MDISEPPEKCNWRELKAWLNEVREAVLTAQAIQGEHITTRETDKGTEISADDCEACP